jgi:AcrR family transcriptional regulator
VPEAGTGEKLDTVWNLNFNHYSNRIYHVDDQEARPARRRLTRAEARERTREELLDAAAHVFARKGFGGASVEEIAEAAGYTTGALYSNFDSKEQLFLELASARRSRAAARRVTTIAQILDETPGDEDPIEALSRFFVELADRQRELAPLQAEFWLYAVRHPEAMGVLGARQREQVDALEPLVARAMERLDAPPGASAREVTVVVLGLVQGLVRERRTDRGSVPDHLFAEALRWVFAGLRSAPTQAPLTVSPADRRRRRAKE